jgi:hypothetical protein
LVSIVTFAFARRYDIQLAQAVEQLTKSSLGAHSTASTTAFSSSSSAPFWSSSASTSACAGFSARGAVGVSFAVEKLAALLLRRELELQPPASQGAGAGTHFHHHGMGFGTGAGFGGGAFGHPHGIGYGPYNGGHHGGHHGGGNGTLAAVAHAAAAATWDRDRHALVLVASVGGADAWTERLRIVGELWREGVRAAFVPDDAVSLAEQIEVAAAAGASTVLVYSSKAPAVVRVRHLLAPGAWASGSSSSSSASALSSSSSSSSASSASEQELPRRDVARFLASAGKRR